MFHHVSIAEPWRREAPGKLGAPPREEASDTFGSSTYLGDPATCAKLGKTTNPAFEYWKLGEQDSKIQTL